MARRRGINRRASTTCSTVIGSAVLHCASFNNFFEVVSDRKADVFDGGVVVAGPYLGQNLAEVLVDGGRSLTHPLFPVFGLFADG